MANYREGIKIILIWIAFIVIPPFILLLIPDKFTSSSIRILGTLFTIWLITSPIIFILRVLLKDYFINYDNLKSAYHDIFKESSIFDYIIDIGTFICCFIVLSNGIEKSLWFIPNSWAIALSKIDPSVL